MLPREGPICLTSTQQFTKTDGRASERELECRDHVLTKLLGSIVRVHCYYRLADDTLLKGCAYVLTPQSSHK